MIGPDIEGLGGISRVVRIWKDSGFFNGLDFCYIPSVADENGSALLFLLQSWLRFVFYAAPRSQVIYIHTSSYRSFYRKSLFILPGLAMRKKTVVHVHPSHFHEFLVSLKGIRKLYAFSILKRVSALVTLTEDMAEKMGRLFPQVPTEILRNAVPVERMNKAPEPQREKNHILFLGWFVPEKGVYELVDAVHILLKRGHPVKLDLYGTKGIEQLVGYVKEKGVDHAVRVNGWILDERKIEALRRSTALVLPSHSEGMPNVVLEAMATRTPVIATPVGGLKEILTHQENALLVNVGDPEDLSEKILLLLKNACLRKKIAENGYRDAKAKFDAPVVRKDFKKTIQMVC